MNDCCWPWPPVPFAPSGTQQQFVPSGQAQLLAGTVSASVTFPSTGSNLTVVVFNTGPDTAFVVAGNSSVVATPAGVPVLPSGMVTFPQGLATTLAAITMIGNAGLTIQSGIGCVRAVYPAFGFVAQVATPVISVAVNLVGTGTNQATALPLPAFTNIISSAPPPAGFILSGGIGAGNIVAQNDDPSHGALIYPPVGARINSLSVNAPYTVGAGGQRITFSTSSSATQWYAG